MLTNSLYKKRLRFPFLILLILAMGGVYSATAQKFYFGANPRQLALSDYRYRLTYKNYPQSFDFQKKSSSVIVPTNFGFTIGYVIDRKWSAEFICSRQYYAVFPEIAITWIAPADPQATNLTLRCKYSVWKKSPSFLDRRSKAPFALNVFGGATYQINRLQTGTSTGRYEGSNGAVVIDMENTFTGKDQVMLHLGAELEIPLYRSLYLAGGYTQYFSFGRKLITTRYTGTEYGNPVNGYRYASGGGSNVTLGLRWYLPKDTKTPQGEQLATRKNFYLGIEYYLFIADGQKRLTYGTGDQAFGLVGGYRKNHDLYEVGLTPLPSLITTPTGYNNTSDERRLYVPLRYKRVIPVFKKGRLQNVEWLPGAGVGFHLPAKVSWASSFLPDGSLAEDYQKVNPFVVGVELGSDLSLNVGSFSIVGSARYLLAFSQTRQLQVFDENAQPTQQYIASRPTGWQLGGALRYRFGK